MTKTELPSPSAEPTTPDFTDVLGRPRTVLVIEDDSPVRRALRKLLEKHGARVVEAETGEEGLGLAAMSAPAVIVLDIGLPDVLGDEVCRELRGWTRTPILVLSARHSEHEKVRLLDSGADDYLTKPFSPAELLARLRALLRRGDGADGLKSPTTVHADDLTIDLHRRSVTRAGVPIHLTPIEWALLRTLIQEAGRTLTHRHLFQAAWGNQHGNAQQYLRVHLTHLRRKIEVDSSAPSLIVTEPGVGYRLELPRSV